MAKVNLDGKYPCMSNWVTLRRADNGGIIVRNCAINEEMELSEREARYLKSLNGDRDIYKIKGFSYDECMEYYEHLNENLLIRDSGRIVDLDGAHIYTLYIPNRKSTNSIIPKILNLLLMITFFPVLIYGVYLFIHYGVNLGEDNFFLNLIFGYILGIGVGGALHECAHACASLSYTGRFFEAGVMMTGFMPGAYVMTDETNIDNILKKGQIHMAGIEMNLLLAGVMMILMVKVNWLSGCKMAMFYIMTQNIFIALFNIIFADGLDGEHAISSLLGGPIVDAAKANIEQMTTREKRSEYFSETGCVNGIANICTSILIMGFQFLNPIFILASIGILIGGLFI